MTSPFVVVREYASELDAELARATLEVNGIDALVRRSDAAGLLRAVEPATLIVRRGDELRARELLDDEGEAQAG